MIIVPLFIVECITAKIVLNTNENVIVCFCLPG
nr:MAG TPA: hypothetical protein [Caudoviricetes sp.]